MCRRARGHAAGALRVAVAVALLWPLAACAARRPSDARPEAAASPVVRGADNGLEVWWWIVSDSRVVPPAPMSPAGPGSVGPEAPQEQPPPSPQPLEVLDLKSSIADALAAYEPAPAPADDHARARCRAAGLRLVAVPIDQLPAIESRLRLVGAVQRQWLGEPAEWTDVARGPAFSSPRTVHDGRRALDLNPGALRLMLRAWIVPDWSAATEEPGAAMRVELLPEHVTLVSRRFPGYDRAGPSEPSPIAEALGELRWSLVLRHGHACMIVPESPDRRWDQPGQDPRRSSTGAVGPDAPAVPSLGEAMLSVDREAGPPRRVRAVIVLIPRLPDRYRLTAAGD